MKVQEKVLNSFGNLQGEKIVMGIDPEAMAHIVTVLTDLYSDTELAVLREYSTNALDSNVQAGVTRPIEIILPSALSPYLHIRDFGVGMGVEEIRDTYSKYGASTKRHTNDLVGTLGLGCKSALTYTDQFTVSAVKDGVLTQVAVSRDADGVPSMTIVHEGPAGDIEQGVEIIVPAKAGNTFAEKAEKFFRFWKPELVLVNDKHPTPLEGEWISDNILLTKKVDKDTVVMGNVAYPMDGTSNTGRYGYGNSYYYRTVFFVEIGEVAFTPSREALQMTPQTKKKVEELKAGIEEAKEKYFSAKVAAATSPWDALAQINLAKSYSYNVKNPSYNGTPIPRSIGTLGYDTNTAAQKFLVASETRGYGKMKGDWRKGIDLYDARFPGYIWVYDFTAADLTNHKRLKMSQWAAKNDRHGFVNWIFCDKLPNSPYINPKNTVSWTEIEAEVLPPKPKDPNAKTRRGLPTGSYSGSVGPDSKKGIEAKDIDVSKPLFWFNGNYWNFPREANELRKDFPDCTIIALGANRIKKFERDFPSAVNVRVAMKQIANDWLTRLTASDKMVLAAQTSGYVNVYRGLDAARVLDPELKKWVVASKSSDAVNLLAMKKRIELFGFSINLEQYGHGPVNDEYVLLTRGMAVQNEKITDHAVLYVNAVYAATKKEVL